MSVVAKSLTNGFGPLPELSDVLKRKIKYNVEDDDMVVWDKGIFLNELHRQGIVFKTNEDGTVDGTLATGRGLRKGTYKGTRMALTEIYNLIEEAYGTPLTHILQNTNLRAELHRILTHKALSPSFPRRGICLRNRTYTNGAPHPLMDFLLTWKQYLQIKKTKRRALAAYLTPANLALSPVSRR
jgi:hypothetical protein